MRRLLVLLVLVLAACGGSVPHPPSPPSAAALAHKIPGCGQLITDFHLSVLTRQDVSCTLQDGAGVEIATFASQGDERQWISDGGDPSTPDPSYAGCCIEGNGWAATIGFPSGGGPIADFDRVLSAIGGRKVSG
jgi:hypothetical protein